MTTAQQWTIVGCLVALTAGLTGGEVVLVPHLTKAVDAWGSSAPDLKPALDGINSSLEQLNRPCGQGKACGTLAEANKTLVKVQDISVTMQRQVAQSSTLVSAAAQTVTTAGQSIATVANAATQTAQEATASLRTLDSTIGKAQPLLDASTLAVQHFDKLASDPIWLQAGKNIVGMTASGDLILADGSRVSKRFADDYTRKQTPWMRFWHYAGDTFDLGALLARHAP